MKKIAKLSFTVLVMALFLSLTFIGCGEPCEECGENPCICPVIYTGTITYTSFNTTFAQTITETNGFMIGDNLNVTKEQRDVYVDALTNMKKNTWTKDDVEAYLKTLNFDSSQASNLAGRLYTKEYCWIAVRDNTTVTLIIK